jgi:tripartite-type tricarboxylate transporter receptor subunit TctC
MITRRAFLSTVAMAGTAAGFGTAAHRPAFAQPYPSSVIRIVVPYSASTPPDILARIVATALSEGEGWNVIVENKSGAVMTIGTNEVLKQPADGYTLLSITAPFAAVPALVPDAKFKIETDFVPLIQVGTAYNVLVVNPSVPVNSVAELIAYLKKDPGKHTFSSGGFGTPAHLLGELFKLETGVQATHVPYTQFPQAIADLISGVNTYQFITILPVVQHINTGKLRALAVMGRNRVGVLKDVPTIVEVGYPKLAAEDWAGILVKTGTPPAVRVIAFEVDHGDVIKPCYGYRFEYGGRVAVFSSDTRYNHNVIKYGTGADLLVHEVASARPELIKEAYVQRIIGHHTTPREAGLVFAQTKPKLAAYTHIALVGSERIPPPTIDDIVAETRETYGGPLAVGEDLMAFEVGETVSVRRLKPSSPPTITVQTRTGLAVAPQLLRP